MKYTVTGVTPKDVWVNKKSGQEMRTYAIQLSGEEGWIKLNQLARSNPPQIGDTLEGTISDETYNNQTVRKFTKDYKGGGASVDLSEVNAKLDHIITLLESMSVRSETPNQHVDVSPDPIVTPEDDQVNLADIPF